MSPTISMKVLPILLLRKSEGERVQVHEATQGLEPLLRNFVLGMGGRLSGHAIFFVCSPVK